MRREETIIWIGENLKLIRETLDSEVTEIQEKDGKLMKLTTLVGLSAECKARAKGVLRLKELDVLTKYKDSGYAPTRLNKLIDAECWQEAELLEYTDRINAGITHAIDGIRTSISLHKTEIENGLKH
jgi:hypothetical protein